MARRGLGRRGVVGIRLHDVHRHAAGAYRRARFGVGVGDGILHRVDVYVRPSESRQGGGGKVIVMNDGADRRCSGGGGNRAGGFRPSGSNVGVGNVGNCVCGLVGVAGIGRGDGVVAPRLVTRQDVQSSGHRVASGCLHAKENERRKIRLTRVGERSNAERYHHDLVLGC